MSSPYSPPRWRPDRLRLACKARGWVHADGEPNGGELARRVNMWRLATERIPISPRLAQRWLTGEVDPGMGRTGHPSSVFDLAHVLEVSVDWLMGRTVRWADDFTRAERWRFAGDEGWS
jgi:hypothetical protein